MDVVLISEITCLSCGFKKQEEMPVDSCQYFYQCDHCKAVLKPKDGDCCVFCSYGTYKCPPIQADRSCC
ncbi:MAG TPA: GDCCVxC domain-containing (seleno)protein [Mucilaginibacter sp.]|nr:GDCCVxC domain-containing (seleno)protein [Mucilaginibacter sp.]